jgi:copper chaperone CopZ
MSEITFHVPEIYCDGCVQSIRNALERLEGVQDVTADLRERRVHVRFAGSVDPLAIKGAIEKAGFDVA